MAESAALLVNEVFPEQTFCQWGLRVPDPLRFLFASRPAMMGQALGIVYRTLATHLDRKAASAGRRLLPGGQAPPSVSPFD